MQSSVRSKLMENIQSLEDENKWHVTTDTTKRLKAMNENLKIEDAHIIAQDIMYAKQKAFDYRDKVGKQLARVLSDAPSV